MKHLLLDDPLWGGRALVVTTTPPFKTKANVLVPKLFHFLRKHIDMAPHKVLGFGTLGRDRDGHNFVLRSDSQSNAPKFLWVQHQRRDSVLRFVHRDSQLLCGGGRERRSRLAYIRRMRCDQWTRL